MSPDVLNQFPAAPVPTLTGFPMALPGAVSQQPLLPSAPPGSVPLGMGPSVLGMNVPAPAGGAAAQPSGAFLPAFPPAQVSLLFCAANLAWPGKRISLTL